MSSAICFNLDQSKNLSFGNGLGGYQTGKCSRAMLLKLYKDNYAYLGCFQSLLLQISLSQTTTFRIFQTEKVCKQQLFEPDENGKIFSKR